MKICQVCGALAASESPTCAQCGESSWLACADDRLPAGEVGTVDSPTEVVIPRAPAYGQPRKGRR